MSRLTSAFNINIIQRNQIYLLCLFQSNHAYFITLFEIGNYLLDENIVCVDEHGAWNMEQLYSIHSFIKLWRIYCWCLHYGLVCLFVFVSLQIYSDEFYYFVGCAFKCINENMIIYFNGFFFNGLISESRRRLATRGLCEFSQSQLYRLEA